MADTRQILSHSLTDTQHCSPWLFLVSHRTRPRDKDLRESILGAGGEGDKERRIIQRRMFRSGVCHRGASQVSQQ